jgi:nucleoside-diphosphate-sugar epimerase
MTERHIVTGAFGYSGKYIAQRLLNLGYQVDTITNSPDRTNPFHGKVRPGIFLRQSPAGKRPDRVRPFLRHPKADRPLRKRRHPGQQHRLDPP